MSEKQMGLVAAAALTYFVFFYKPKKAPTQTDVTGASQPTSSQDAFGSPGIELPGIQTVAATESVAGLPDVVGALGGAAGAGASAATMPGGGLAPSLGTGFQDGQEQAFQQLQTQQFASQGFAMVSQSDGLVAGAPNDAAGRASLKELASAKPRDPAPSQVAVQTVKVGYGKGFGNRTVVAPGRVPRASGYAGARNNDLSRGY